MGRETDIGWCDSTINPTSGCDGCELYKPGPDGEDTASTCYAKDLHLQRLAKSYPALYGPRFGLFVSIADPKDRS
jgi:protein gp37